ncbi:hypothetical protein PHJA_001434000 [Phtheirospermum japonicum]|uniref:Uncharacterized protein n=1 Tax=Phtheirospermum japonicum TaxID=374723 RepID=A0A830BXQ2_9LAMI|nr:hypothetical protein PHJA_001434000 [Phtheirospermum japonicum]
MKVSCPICLEVLQTENDDDLKMTLAVHMSLWHSDDVVLQLGLQTSRAAHERSQFCM